MFFKGYVVTKDKKAIESFKGKDNLKTLKDVQHFDEYAGVLAPETILIDIDDLDSSNILFNIIKGQGLKCRVYQTSRGKHFLFKNSGVESNKTGTNLAIGIKADIKLGSRNSYEVIKIDGKPRKILRDCPEDEVDLLPKWLHPVPKTDMPFLKMDAGSGRNDALFRYILTLQSNDFSVDECKQCIQVINDKVLQDPLEQSELDVILREEAFQAPVFFKGSTFLHDKFATFLKNNHHIIRINGQLHVYKNGIYISGYDELEAIMIHHIPFLQKAKRSEVLSYLQILILENTPMAARSLIAFRNGVLDLETGKLKPFSHEMIFTNRIPWDYNPNAYNAKADETLNNIACGDEQIRKILEECIGSCFYRSNTLGDGRAFILTGEGSNGKSTFLAMIQNVLGEDNISALDLKELSEKFQNAELFGKLANIGDDISDEFIVNASVFKKLVTGNRIQVQRKGERPFEFENYAKMLFSANTIPRIKDKTGAVLRRLLIVPFNAKFDASKKDFDESIKYKLQSQEVMEYLIKIGVEALKGVIEKHRFTESDKVKKEIKEYQKMNNPLLMFIEECNDEKYEFMRNPIPEVFEKYSCFCKVSGYQSVSRNEFTRQMQSELKCAKKQMRIQKGKNPVWVFVPESEVNYGLQE